MNHAIRSFAIYENSSNHRYMSLHSSSYLSMIYKRACAKRHFFFVIILYIPRLLYIVNIHLRGLPTKIFLCLINLWLVKLFTRASIFYMCCVLSYLIHNIKKKKNCLQTFYLKNETKKKVEWMMQYCVILKFSINLACVCLYIIIFLILINNSFIFLEDILMGGKFK